MATVFTGTKHVHTQSKISQHNLSVYIDRYFSMKIANVRCGVRYVKSCRCVLHSNETQNASDEK